MEYLRQTTKLVKEPILLEKSHITLDNDGQEISS